MPYPHSTSGDTEAEGLGSLPGVRQLTSSRARTHLSPESSLRPALSTPWRVWQLPGPEPKPKPEPEPEPERQAATMPPPPSSLTYLPQCQSAGPAESCVENKNTAQGEGKMGTMERKI